MSRVDENGTVHPTDEDPYSIGAMAHLAHCFECNVFALPAQHNITSPCHGAKVKLFTSYSGEMVWAECQEKGCHNSWDNNGEPE